MLVNGDHRWITNLHYAFQDDSFLVCQWIINYVYLLYDIYVQSSVKMVICTMNTSLITVI